MENNKIKPIKETDQILFEELTKGWKFISSEFDLEVRGRRTIQFRNGRGELATIKFSSGGTLATRKENIKRALIDYDPEVADLITVV